MLTAPVDFLLPHVHRNSFQDELLHRLPRDRGEADQPVVLQVVLIALLEDRSGVCFPPVFGHLIS